MNERAASVTGSRPTEGAPSLIVSEPDRAKCAATRAGSPLHHASVYRCAKPSGTSLRRRRVEPLSGWYRRNCDFLFAWIDRSQIFDDFEAGVSCLGDVHVH